MDLTFVIGIVRDLQDRCKLEQLAEIETQTKQEDDSDVTEIDSLAEEIVLQHFSEANPLIDFACVREESTKQPEQIGKIKESNYLLTIDGIDGTGDFIRHFNEGQKNSKWLMGMTAFYKKHTNGMYDPLFAFAYQPTEDRCFVMIDGRSLLVRDPLGKAEVFQLSVEHVQTEPMRGSLDVWLDKKENHWVLAEPDYKHQSGPSGFNMASLAASAAPKEALITSSPVNFTTFHYKLWDFGLWPVLNAAGFTTMLKAEGQLKSVKQLDLNWFGTDADPPAKCDATPIIISKHNDFDPFAIT